MTPPYRPGREASGRHHSGPGHTVNASSLWAPPVRHCTPGWDQAQAPPPARTVSDRKVEPQGRLPKRGRCRQLPAPSKRSTSLKRGGRSLASYSRLFSLRRTLFLRRFLYILSSHGCLPRSVHSPSAICGHTRPELDFLNPAPAPPFPLASTRSR